MSTRRNLLAGIAALSTASAVTIATGAAAHGTDEHPDAVLIRVCQQFAEADLEDWYRYCTTPIGEEDDGPPFDPTTLEWITATPATTLAGWQAKALACAAFNRDMYDDSQDERDVGTPILAALLREMAGPARTAILTRLEQKYGPLPEGYTPDWRWIGRPRS